MYRRSSSERPHVSPFTASPARRRNPSHTRPRSVHSDFAALLPARHPLAHAHARLYPPHGPVTSNSSPHAYNPGASFDSSVSGQNSRHFAPPGITCAPSKVLLMPTLVPFTATSPHSFRPDIRSPTPTRDCTRRTAPSRQTAPRTRTTRAQASIPASPDKTPGTSRRPVSPARRQKSF